MDILDDMMDAIGEMMDFLAENPWIIVIVVVSIFLTVLAIYGIQCLIDRVTEWFNSLG
jgi:hypothetical protein